MMNCVKVEIKKAIFNPFFLISIVFMMLFSLFSASYVIQNYQVAVGYLFPEQIKNGINEFFPIWNFYQNWIGAERISIAASLFFFLLPVFSVFPAALSFRKEKDKGYLRTIIFRVGKLGYISAKSCAVFLSGFLVVFLPLIVNVILVSAFIPTSLPQVNYNFYNYISYGEFLADLFFSNPILYVGFYVLLDSFFSGVVALLAFALSFFIRYKIITALCPFFIFIFIDYAMKIVAFQGTSEQSMVSFEISPLGWLRSSHIGMPVFGWVIALELLVIVSFSLIVIISRGCHDEIF